MILIDDRDRSVDHIHHGALRRRVDRKRERIDNQQQQDRVTEQAQQLFNAELNDMSDVLHRLGFLLLQQHD